MLALPEPAPTLAPEVLANIAVTEVGNPITAVLLAFRAMDTLLEAIVLLFALIGVWSLAPDRAWGGRPGLLQQADPNGMLAYVARVLPPIGIVAGIYIFWIGADHPGGKFQGATILAAMWLLVMMAGLADAPPISRRWLRWLLVAGPLAFIAVGVVGAVTAGAFLAYPQGFAKTADPGHRVRADAHAHAGPGPDAAGRSAARRDAVTAGTLFGLCAAVLIGVGLYGLIVNPHPLRKILAFNVVGSGVFLLFGAIAHRGRRGRHGRRPGAAGPADHRHRGRVLGHGAGRRAAVAAVRRDRLGHALE